jgi:hypothetical protein
MKHLVITACGRGGVGKTTAGVALADYLSEKGYDITPFDCDTENAGKLSSFSQWFGGSAETFNLRNPDDCDRLLEAAANSEADYILCDLPANASGDIAEWWNQVVTPETLKELGLHIIGLGVVSPHPGSAESVHEWIDVLGSRVRYLVALNRLLFERVPGPANQVFSVWNALPVSGVALSSFEIPHLHGPAMEAMIRSGKLPSDVIRDKGLHVMPRARVKQWRDTVHRNLDATGLFVPKIAQPLSAGR